MSNEIGKKLKQLRMSKVLSQDEVSRKLNITRSTVSNYENGRRIPHLKDLQKYCNAFGVGLDFFGIDASDEAFDLLVRAKKVFDSPNVPVEVKEDLYKEFMKLYLQMKG